MSIALSSLPVGAKVKDMTSLYPDGSPIMWTIIDHNHSGYPVNSTTLFANKYNGFKKSETSKNVSSYNFTNSDVYSYMVNEILGNHISSSLKKRILKTSVTLFNWYGPATYDKNIIKKDLDIFLLSYGEMSSSGNLNSGDSRFSYFNDRSKRISSDVGYGNSGYWTKDVQNSNNLKVLNFYKATSISSDTISYSFYSDEQNAIRPVINVKNDIEVQGSPDVDGAYVMSLVENKYIFKDGEEIKKYSSHDSSSVPEMEGYNTPEGLVSSSKELAAGYEAWRAFNSSSGFWHSGTAGAQWISYRFSEAKKITKYSWKTYTATGAPKDWKFEGWDGQKWVVLDIRIGEVGWSNQQEKTYEFSNSNSYIEYRFNLTANNGNGNYDPVYIKLFESPSWEVIGNSIASKELFALHGMTDLSLINNEAMQQLNSDQIELLCWMDEVTPSRQLGVSALPNYALLAGTATVIVNGAEKVTLYANQTTRSVIRIAVSSDEGVTWKGKSLLNLSDLISVKTNGFTPEELNALTKEQIATLFPNGIARFAFYLEKEKLTDMIEIQSLSVGGKVCTISPTATDLSLIYEVLREEKPTLYGSRDDGVSWKEISQDEMASLSEQLEGSSLRVKVVLKNGQEIHALSYVWA